jgi:hypothetical protein
MSKLLIDGANTTDCRPRPKFAPDPSGGSRHTHPNSEHRIDWFPITMRLTALQQQTKALPEERLQTGAAASKPVASSSIGYGTAM